MQTIITSSYGQHSCKVGDHISVSPRISRLKRFLFWLFHGRRAPLSGSYVITAINGDSVEVKLK